MTSEKQIASNRRNACLGGPKTAGGKTAGRLHALSNGIFTQELLLPGEDASLLAGLRDNLVQELQPEGEMEAVLVDRIVSSTWRLRRAVRSGTMVSPKYLMSGTNPDANDFAIDYRFSAWQLILKYETTVENQIYAAIRELYRLQNNRKSENSPLKKTPF